MNEQSRQLARSYDNSMVALIEKLTKDPAVDVDKLDRLLSMRDAAINREAEAMFNNAMADAQEGMEPVRTDSGNPQTRSKYASYAAIDKAVRPIYSRCGFALSFNTDNAISGTESVRVLCYVCHRGGFTRVYHVDIPADGKGARGGEVMTRTHALGSAVTYGRRYLINMIFNIAVEQDDDGNAASRTRSQHNTQRQANSSYDQNTGEVYEASAAQYEAARNAADQGKEAFIAFCKTLKRSEYKAMESHLKSLKAVVDTADGVSKTSSLEKEIENSDG